MKPSFDSSESPKTPVRFLSPRLCPSTPTPCQNPHSIASTQQDVHPDEVQSLPPLHPPPIQYPHPQPTIPAQIFSSTQYQPLQSQRLPIQYSQPNMHLESRGSTQYMHVLLSPELQPNHQPPQHGQLPAQSPLYAQQPGSALSLTQQLQNHQHLGHTHVLGQPQQSYCYEIMPASPGYHSTLLELDVGTDAIHLAGMRLRVWDEAALDTAIHILTQPKYQCPLALDRLKAEFKYTWNGTLPFDELLETEDALAALFKAFFRGPLKHDCYTLSKALCGEVIDEKALNEVLLCRSNADLKAISRTYHHVKKRKLLNDIKEKVDASLFALYEVTLAGPYIRNDDATPVFSFDIDNKITDIHRLAEGSAATDQISVVTILAGANAAQLRAMGDAYQRKYNCSLQGVIEQAFQGSVRDALLRILTPAMMESGEWDAKSLWTPLMNPDGNERDDRALIYWTLRVYWDNNIERLRNAHIAYRNTYGMSLADQLRLSLARCSKMYARLLIALIGEDKCMDY